MFQHSKQPPPPLLRSCYQKYITQEHSSTAEYKVPQKVMEQLLEVDQPNISLSVPVNGSYHCIYKYVLVRTLMRSKVGVPQPPLGMVMSQNVCYQYCDTIHRGGIRSHLLGVGAY